MHVHLHRLGKLTVNYKGNCVYIYVQAELNKVLHKCHTNVIIVHA